MSVRRIARVVGNGFLRNGNDKVTSAGCEKIFISKYAIWSQCVTKDFTYVDRNASSLGAIVPVYAMSVCWSLTGIRGRAPSNRRNRKLRLLPPP